ncbi:Guanine nucleotide-binding protein subunit gamma [Dimargaris cristalligena]|uniref:Guanine nucleotide-binding protein subunit gamma n=1 Tax=Dimargaris cristalligena TaxID=215637 RepID=A0A4P9ZR81_9FUNG|nr:Guanine nucleotide-binding protein subunit gamma [Dimargaris cristalligena]RKP35251.1 G-protein gamma subunit [Dimargaris cristalligena]|eukprot:RKP35251.1 G-protein gamma subunit [Dimargaris cristalligena]
MYSSQKNMAEQRYKKLVEKNQRLRDQLHLATIPVSQASSSLCDFILNTKDPLVPSVWGAPSADPFATKEQGCCSTM